MPDHTKPKPIPAATKADQSAKSRAPDPHIPDPDAQNLHAPNQRTPDQRAPDPRSPFGPAPHDPAYEAWFLAAVEVGLKQADQGQTIPHEQVMESLRAKGILVN